MRIHVREPATRSDLQTSHKGFDVGVFLLVRVVVHESMLLEVRRMRVVRIPFVKAAAKTTQTISRLPPYAFH